MEKIEKESSHVLIRLRELEDENKLLKRQVNELGVSAPKLSLKDTTILEPALRKLLEDQEKIMYMAVHDLKNPLSNIKAINGIFKKDLEKPIEKQLTESNKLAFLNIMETVCDQTFTIIKDLLFVGELKVKSVELTKIEIGNLLKANLTKNLFLANEKDISIEMRLPPDPVFTLINEDKFHRMIDNLLTNAIKFTHKAGKIIIELLNYNKKLVLKISDNGIGIPPHNEEKIFDQFTDASRKGTLEEGGTGMGLYIVKKIIEMHNGKLWFESTVNEGTTFFIELKSM